MMSRGRILVLMAQRKCKQKDLEYKYKIVGNRVEKVQPQKATDRTGTINTNAQACRPHLENEEFENSYEKRCTSIEHVCHDDNIVVAENAIHVEHEHKQLETSYGKKFTTIEQECHGDTTSVAENIIHATQNEEIIPITQMEVVQTTKRSSSKASINKGIQRQLERNELENEYKIMGNLVEKVRCMKATRRSGNTNSNAQIRGAHLENICTTLEQVCHDKTDVAENIIHVEQTGRRQLEHNGLEKGFETQFTTVEQVCYDDNTDVAESIIHVEQTSRTQIEDSEIETSFENQFTTIEQVCYADNTDFAENILHLEQTSRTQLEENEFETSYEKRCTTIEQVCHDDNTEVTEKIIHVEQTTRTQLEHNESEIRYACHFTNVEQVCHDDNADVSEYIPHLEQTSSKKTSYSVESIVQADSNDFYSDTHEYDNSDNDPDWKPDKKRDRSIDSDSSEDDYLHRKLKEKKMKQNQVMPETNTQNEEMIPISQEEVVQTTKRKRSKTSIKKENQRKRMKGINYLGVRKRQGYCNERPGRVLAPRTCSTACLKGKGGRKCTEINDEYRQEIFEAFWENMDWAEKGVYVISLVQKVPTARPAKQTSRRNHTYIYHLKVDGERVRVCKELFLSTLGVKEDMVYGWINKDTNNTGIPIITSTQNKVHKNARAAELAENFLNSLPKLPSHYCRSETNKLYLETNLTTFTDVYNVYKEQLRDDGVDNQYVFGKTAFKDIFNEMNLAIFKPKKDQCDLCSGYNVGNVSEMVYTEHVKRKDEARQSKANDKTEAELRKKQLVLTMDVQSILLCPKLEASCMYYKTKLCCHNFTFFNNISKACSCYFWTETATDLTATTFVSCIIDYLEDLDRTDIDRVIIYSDGCGYQNRNVTLANALSVFATKHKITIEQKYLERGHTQMECDSVHAHIETKLKNKDIYVPSQYVEVMKSARPKQPYTVKYCDYTFFKDYSSISNYTSIRPGVGVGSAVVADIRQLQYSPDGTIQYKTGYEGLEYESIRKPRKSSGNITPDNASQIRTSPLPIKKSKYEHLQQIKQVIPKDYHSFYINLTHS